MCDRRITCGGQCSSCGSQGLKSGSQAWWQVPFFPCQVISPAQNLMALKGNVKFLSHTSEQSLEHNWDSSDLSFFFTNSTQLFICLLWNCGAGRNPKLLTWESFRKILISLTFRTFIYIVRWNTLIMLHGHNLWLVAGFLQIYIYVNTYIYIFTYSFRNE